MTIHREYCINPLTRVFRLLYMIDDITYLSTSYSLSFSLSLITDLYPSHISKYDTISSDICYSISILFSEIFHLGFKTLSM